MVGMRLVAVGVVTVRIVTVRVVAVRVVAVRIVAVRIVAVRIVAVRVVAVRVVAVVVTSAAEPAAAAAVPAFTAQRAAQCALDARSFRMEVAPNLADGVGASVRWYMAKPPTAILPRDQIECRRWRSVLSEEFGEEAWAVRGRRRCDA